MSASPKSVRFDDDSMWVSLADGRTIAVPLAWFPRLLDATNEQRLQVQLSRVGLHWDGLDEDVSVAGLLAGCSDMTRTALPGNKEMRCAADAVFFEMDRREAPN